MVVESPIESPTTPAAELSAVEAGVIEEARARQRRLRGTAVASILGAAATAAVVFASIGGGGSRAVTGSPPPASRPGSSPSVSLAACHVQRPGTAIQTAPSKSLLSILGVLRRPATPADILPARNETQLFTFLDVFVRYVRLARVISGRSYYVIPVHYAVCGLTSRPDGMIVLEPGVGGGGDDDAVQIEAGEAESERVGFRSTAIKMLVPNGVATITLNYPPGPVGGFNHRHAAAFTATASVVNNLVVVNVPRSGDQVNAATMTWRGVNGHIIKTFNRL